MARLPLGCQDGEGPVELHHGDDEEAAGQQEGGPEEGDEEGLRPVEAPVQRAGLVAPGRGEAAEDAVLVEVGSDPLHVGPGRRVVVQAVRDVGALRSESRRRVGVSVSQGPRVREGEGQGTEKCWLWTQPLDGSWDFRLYTARP